MIEPTDAVVTCSTCGAQMTLVVDEHTPDGPSFATWRCPTDRRHGDRMWPDAPEPPARTDAEAETIRRAKVLEQLRTMPTDAFGFTAMTLRSTLQLLGQHGLPAPSLRAVRDTINALAIYLVGEAGD